MSLIHGVVAIKMRDVTVYHYGDTRNHPLGLVDLYNGRVYEDEDIN
jgi:hypothetical protein